MKPPIAIMLCLLLTIIIYAAPRVFAGSAYKGTPGGTAGISQDAADARYSQKNGVGAFNRISSTAPDGTHMINVSNTAPYSGPRTDVIFATDSSAYYCTKTGTCRRFDR